MKGTPFILLGVGGSIGFVAGNIFLATKVMESEKMRSALADIISDKVSKLIFDEQKIKHPTKISYRDYYNSRNRSKVNYREYRNPRSTENLMFENKEDAESALDKAREIIELYGVISIADYYDCAGVSSGNYQHCHYGWTDLDTATVERASDAYTIKMPTAIKND